MKIGLMIFDDSKQSLPEKVGKAIAFYEQKYGRKPTLAMVNPKDYQDCNLIAIETNRSIRKNHLWLGVKEG
jgi:hypothetical protein